MEDVVSLLKKTRASSLDSPPTYTADHSHHLLNLSLMGWPSLAADHIFHPQLRDYFVDVIGSFIRRSGVEIASVNIESEEGIILRAKIYETFIEIIHNLHGVEPIWAGFSKESVERSVKIIQGALSRWVNDEFKVFGSPVVFLGVIEKSINPMMRVGKGNSLVAELARKIKSAIDPSDPVNTFIKSTREVFYHNPYRKAYEEKACKFGNDYALGLRWLRHLGFTQVSTNPLLVAIAYEDIPELIDEFKLYAKNVLRKKFPHWFEQPEKHIHDIVMEATRYTLMDCFYVFRLPFILSNYHDGLVSYQLNPLLADNVEESVKAAIEFYKRLEEDLKIYDEYLLWGYNVVEKGRPNLVVKVPAVSPAAIQIIERINELGIGQNITLSFSISQQVLCGLSAIKGMAKALKKGIIPTQTYITNMGGRLQEYLREDVAEDLLKQVLERVSENTRKEIILDLAEKLKVDREVVSKVIEEKGLEGAVKYLCDTKIIGRSLLREPFVEILVKHGLFKSKDDAYRYLSELDTAIILSGTLVARRVYSILFSPENKMKLLEYIMNEFQLTKEEASLILDRIDLLPAAKRHPFDTLYTFGPNVTNTEGPAHQLSVVNYIKEKGIEIQQYYNSISRDDISSNLEKYSSLISKYKTFMQAYESSPEVYDALEKIGINVNYGVNGLKVTEWGEYKCSVKMFDDFMKAYNKFAEKILGIIKSL
ncbi:MAG: transaldolase family protein [Thermosphaera sp.]